MPTARHGIPKIGRVGTMRGSSQPMRTSRAPVVDVAPPGFRVQLHWGGSASEIAFEIADAGVRRSAAHAATADSGLPAPREPGGQTLRGR
jgi:hypothetical protein